MVAFYRCTPDDGVPLLPLIVGTVESPAAAAEVKFLAAAVTFSDTTEAAAAAVVVTAGHHILRGYTRRTWLCRAPQDVTGGDGGGDERDPVRMVASRARSERRPRRRRRTTAQRPFAHAYGFFFFLQSDPGPNLGGGSTAPSKCYLNKYSSKTWFERFFYKCKRYYSNKKLNERLSSIISRMIFKHSRIVVIRTKYYSNHFLA